MFLCCIRRRSSRQASLSSRSLDEEGSRTRVFSIAELADTDRKIPMVRSTRVEPMISKPRDALLTPKFQDSNVLSPIASVMTAEVSSTGAATGLQNEGPTQMQNNLQSTANGRKSELGRFRFSGFPLISDPFRPETLISVASASNHESVQEYPIYLAKEDIQDEARRPVQSTPTTLLSPPPQAFPFHKKYNVNITNPENNQMSYSATVATAPTTPSSVFSPLQKTSTSRSSVTLSPGVQLPGFAETKDDRVSTAEVDEEELDRLVCKIAPLTPIGSTSGASQSLYGGPKSQLRDQMPSPTETASQRSAVMDNVASGGADSPTIGPDLIRSASFGSAHIDARRASVTSVPRYREMGSWVSDQERWIKGIGDFEPSAG